MPTYFFDIDEAGVTSRDEDGIELPDLDRAMTEVLVTLPALARETPVGKEPLTLRSRIRDDVGRVLFEATLVMRTRQFDF